MAEYATAPRDEEAPESPETHAQHIIQGAKNCVRRWQDAMSDNIQEALEDLRYKMGEQWPATVSAAREAEDRPCLVFNKIWVKQAQISNDFKQNPPAVEVHPANEQATPTVARIVEEMVRAIVYGSSGEEACKVAFDSAVDIGWGFARVRADYVSETSFAQEILIDALPHTLNVCYDAQSLKVDGSDAKECVLLTQMPRDEFEALYPDAEAVNTSYLGQEGMGDWLTEDMVQVGEYYCIEYQLDRLLELRSGQAVLESHLADPRVMILAQQLGFTDRQRSVRRPQVRWYKLTAVDLLEEADVAGAFIPVVPLYGNWVILEHELKRFGAIRMLRDPQQVLNYAETTNVELVGLQPRAPWVGPEGFMAGHETEWKNSNNSNIVALEYAREGLDGLPITEPPQRIPFPAPPMALVEMKQTANQYIDEISGIAQPQQVTPGSQRSRVSLRESDSQASMATFHYFDHARASLLHLHKIIVSWIPVYYTTAQVVRTLGLNGKQGLMAINQRQDLGTGIEQVVNDVTVGKYDVRLATGPSYQTQKEEARDKLVTLVAATPELMGKIGSDVVKALDIPGGEHIAAKLAATEPPVPDPHQDPTVALMQTQAQLQHLQQEAQALNAVAQQLEQQAKDLTEQNRTLRLAAATLEAERRGERAEADVEKRQDALKLETARLAQQEKELQMTAQIARLQAQLAQQQYKTTVAQNGSREDE